MVHRTKNYIQIPPDDVVAVATGGQDNPNDHNKRMFGEEFANWRKKWNKKV